MKPEKIEAPPEINVPYREVFEELKGKSIGVFDYETDGFLEVVSKAHCGVVRDPRGVSSGGDFDPDNIQESLAYLDTRDVLVGHNIIGYDLPMLAKLFGWRPRSDVLLLDTLFMSRMYNPDLEGKHSLKSWGVRLGNNKIDYTPPDNDWANYNPEMFTYCKQDVDLNVDVFNKLLQLLANWSWKSIICEMQTATIIQRQMQHGFVFKLEEAELLHAQFTTRILELEEEVHETFKPLPKLIREVQPRVKKDLSLSSVGVKSYGDDYESAIPLPEFTTTTEKKPLFTPMSEFTDEYKYWCNQGKPEGPWLYKAVTYKGRPGTTTWKEIKTLVPTTGAFSLIEYKDFSLGSRQQIAERLTKAGYKLTKFTPKTDKGGGGNPIVDDATLADAVDHGIPEAEPLSEYFMITKREAMIKDWIKRAVYHEDQGVHRLHGFVNSLGAATNRMTHNSPNVAQTPAGYSPYGKECRSLFTVRRGYKLVGCDADGLELRCLAHYMGDSEYAEAIINGRKEDGSDIHTVNQRAAGLDTRDQAKTFIYAFLYGAGDAKLGGIAEGTAGYGKKLKERFLDATPALKQLRVRIKNITSRREWLKGIDGRILRIRSQHSALNTLLQGMGAIVMKYWLIEVAKNADAAELDWNPSANVHDEGQFEVKEEHVDQFKAICEAAFLTVSNDLDLACICTGSADHGNNWYETH